MLDAIRTIMESSTLPKVWTWSGSRWLCKIGVGTFFFEHYLKISRVLVIGVFAYRSRDTAPQRHKTSHVDRRGVDPGVVVIYSYRRATSEQQLCEVLPAMPTISASNSN